MATPDPAPKLTVGQHLWFVPNASTARRRWLGSHEVTIAKIGRKWATLASFQGRVHLVEMFVDGGEYSSPGQCYLSREDYQARAELEEAWDRFRNAVSGSRIVPNGVTLSDIAEARRLLRLDR